MEPYYELGQKEKRRIAEYYVKENSTIRKTAKHFKIPKTYIHRALVEFRTDRRTAGTELAKRVTELTAKNVSERSKRGGQATKEKYSKKKKD